VPLMSFALDPAGFHPASVVALAFATAGAYAGALLGRVLDAPTRVGSAEQDPIHRSPWKVCSRKF
jgi:Na+/glutamate symporter